MTEESAEAGRVYRLMESSTEANDAIEAVVAAARRELRVFDASPRALRTRGFGNPARVEVLRKLLLASRAHLVRIALHDTRGIETELPRLVNLLANFSGQLQIHRTVDEAAEVHDVLIIADDADYWRKPHIDHPRSIFTLHSQAETKPFLVRFEEIWEKSEPAVSGSTAGL